MRKISLLAGLILFSLCGYSQTVSLGVRGGLSIKNQETVCLKRMKKFISTKLFLALQEASQKGIDLEVILETI
jgi:hypothetical protein